MQRTDNRRALRLGDQIMQELASMLALEMEDPRLSRVSITGVRMNPSLEVAEVLYTTRGSEEDRIQAAKALKRANGYLRREVAKRIKTRVAPELRFVHDDYLEEIVYDSSPGSD